MNGSASKSYWQRVLVDARTPLPTDSLVDHFKILIRGLWDSDQNAALLGYIIDSGNRDKPHHSKSSMEYKLARSVAERLNIFEYPGVPPEDDNFLSYLENSPAIPRYILLDRSAYPEDIKKEYLERISKGTISKSFMMMDGLSAGIQGTLIEIVHEYESQPEGTQGSGGGCVVTVLLVGISLAAFALLLTIPAFQ